MAVCECVRTGTGNAKTTIRFAMAAIGAFSLISVPVDYTRDQPESARFFCFFNFYFYVCCHFIFHCANDSGNHSTAGRGLYFGRRFAISFILPYEKLLTSCHSVLCRPITGPWLTPNPCRVEIIFGCCFQISFIVHPKMFWFAIEMFAICSFEILIVRRWLFSSSILAIKKIKKLIIIMSWLYYIGSLINLIIFHHFDNSQNSFPWSAASCPFTLIP